MSPRRKSDDQAPSAVERAFAAVSASIITGETAPGALITEGEVADELGISRTPVREAFLQLQTCRLLTLFPKRGAVVATVADKEVADLLAVRIMLESSAIRALDGNPLPDDVAHDLDDLVAQQVVAEHDGDLLAFSQADFAFHSRVIRAGDNDVIEDLFAQLGPRLELLTHRAVRRDATSPTRLLADHRVLATLARAGDAQAYEAALRAHVQRGNYG
ncbi:MULTISPECIES: GntR family transcriptional regulator [Oerskovia]|uniref:GntR family transcriptional regulator n=1 Tax=Oerskovia rustica TaxID=2762237 RepID=A0ABR8RPW5_9CELL|nr:GntR family transcriptional regulator [Oerskovia rustica]MBD7949507.1 GntR family transcriptional regulator [Oerskovia rustica]